MIKPPFLRRGTKVMVISPSGLIERSRIEAAIVILKGWGLEIVTGRHVYGSNGIYSGRDGERLSDLQSALDTKDITAIFCTRGGYGISRIIADADFTKFIKHPKWLVGFSDITMLHSAVNKLCGVCSLHAPVLNSFTSFGEKDDSLTRLRSVLGAKDLSYEIKAHPLNREGKVSGILTGGNLSLLYNMRGTPLDIEPEGKILFIEDVGEYLYHIDRIMMNLKNGGVLSKINGLICGGFTEMKDQPIPFGKTPEEIIIESVKDYRFPVVFGFPAGHMQPNYPLIMGGDCILHSGEKKVQIKFQ